MVRLLRGIGGAACVGDAWESEKGLSYCGAGISMAPSRIGGSCGAPEGETGECDGGLEERGAEDEGVISSFVILRSRFWRIFGGGTGGGE